jgi:uncharacterized protein YegJ (DUF2314 family)
MSILGFCVLLPAGCDPSSSDHVPQGDDGNNVAGTDSPWQGVGEGAVVAVDREQQAALDKATEEARRTMESARARWQGADETERLHWAVKWAAETESGGVEYVWVRPAHWSAFRVEGVLLNQPATPLTCGRKLGESVSFAIEELADWMYEARDKDTGMPVRLGGYTVDALGKEFGPPPN